MIIATEDLARLRAQVTMVDGAFDPLHPGHVEYFEAAAALGSPVLCNVSPDEYVQCKHAPLLLQRERAAIIDAIRWIDYTHLARTSTADVLRALAPRVYAKGADWQGRLPAEELTACAELGVEVVYLDTVRGSSSAILERYRNG